MDASLGKSVTNDNDFGNDSCDLRTFYKAEFKTNSNQQDPQTTATRDCPYIS